jgi:predicted metalloprotease with PDZ domain
MKINRKLLFLAFLTCVFHSFLYAQSIRESNSLSDFKTLVKIDLRKATGDHKIFVEVEPPVIRSDKIKYFMPKIVPGTYTINNFGRFISGLKAYSADGSELPVERIDTNSWEISRAAELKKISYWAEDTYNSNSIPVVFEPTGMLIDSGKVFMLNNYSYAGYFEGYKDYPYILAISKPEGFYGSTSLDLGKTENSTDYYYPQNYFDLHDNPILYTIPDTSSVMVNNIKILVSVYSPNRKVTSVYLKEHTRELFEAQGRYLGGTLPAEKYSVLVYMPDNGTRSGSAGALEHFKSTTFVFPEIDQGDFLQIFKDVVSHEFFHIVTPLSIHSVEINDFDFMSPKMSRHLWLYEGSTEYYAHHSQVKYGLITPEAFIRKIREKISFSTSHFNDTVPFTELSKGALDRYKSQYQNVYMKGALINMCLDLLLLQLSEGKYGLRDLKSGLSQKFGPDKPFNDDELFDIITEMTYPEVRSFFSKYVEGNERLPYKEFLNYAGFEYERSQKKLVPAMFGSSLNLNADGTITVYETGEFGKKLKLKKEDEIVSINGYEISRHNFEEVTEKFENETKAGNIVTVVVMRKSKGSSVTRKILKAETYMTEKEIEHEIHPAANPTPKQQLIRNAWLNH